MNHNASLALFSSLSFSFPSSLIDLCSMLFSSHVRSGKPEEHFFSAAQDFLEGANAVVLQKVSHRESSTTKLAPFSAEMVVLHGHEESKLKYYRISTCNGSRENLKSMFSHLSKFV